MSKDKVYQEKIGPLVQQLYKLCKENNISMLAAFDCTEKDKEPNDDSYLWGCNCESFNDRFNMAYGVLDGQINVPKLEKVINVVEFLIKEDEK